MIQRTVRENSVEIEGKKCKIKIVSLGSDKLHIVLQGHDDGELGRIPFDELNHRLAGAGKTELFIDTSLATAVSLAVTEQWENWFRSHKSRISKAHIFAPSKFFFITGSIIKELAGMSEMIQLYSDRELFERAVPEAQSLRNDTPSPVSFSGNETFQGKSSSVRIARLRPGVLYLKISGRDSGDTLNPVLNVLTSELRNYPGPFYLFVDAMETTGISSVVSEGWTRWISGNSKRIRGIDVCTNSRFVTLVVSAAKIFSRTGELIHVLENRSDFLNTIETEAPNSSGLL